MTATLPVETIEDLALVERWVLRVNKEHPTLHEAVLRCFAAQEGTPTETDLGAVLAPRADAEGWRRAMQVLVLPPYHYSEVFGCEDALSGCQRQWLAYQDDCRGTAQTLASLKQQKESTLAYRYSLTDPEEQAEVQAKYDALDAEQVTVLRHQEDLPGAGARIERAMAEAQDALDAAQAALLETRKGHIAGVQDQWREELLAALAGEGAVLRLLATAKYLDAAWKTVGVSPDRYEHGSAYLKEGLQPQVPENLR